jgi:HK97 family phage prohead protease
MPKPIILSEEQFREAAKDGTVDGTQTLRKAFIAEVKAMDDRALDFVISSAAVDRMGDTIAVDGWDLGNYRKNPVVLWAHDASQMPVAKASNIRIEDGKLKARAEFMPAEISAFAESVFRALKGGFLSAVSVGFAPVKYAFSDEPGRSFGIDFLQQELLEFSVCPVPANPEALIEARSAGIDIAPIRDWAVKLLAGENLALIDSARLAAISALPEEFRTDAQKASGSKGASGLYRRCANRIERALKGEETTSDPALPPAEPIADLPVTQPQTLTLEMARRRLALLG